MGDPVLGVDIHVVMVAMPPPAPPTPVPLPHPFIGAVFDPLGAALGAVIGLVLGGGGPVLINSLPCGNTGTEVLGVPHFPMPPGFMFAPFDISRPMLASGALIFGSDTVTMAGSSIARFSDLVMTCNFPINLPTSVCMAIPLGAPVEVGGPMSIDVLAAVTTAIRTKWVSDQLHRLTRGRFSRTICFFTGHPVDVMTGEVLTDETEARLPGPLPLTLARNYYSRSRYDGPLGPGWTHTLDASVTAGDAEVILRLPDGRELSYDPLAEGAAVWDDIERHTFERTDTGYRLTTHDGTRYTFEAVDVRPRARTPGLHPLRADANHPTHRLTRVTDRCGNATLARYESGRFVGVVDALGRALEVRWTPDGARWEGIYHRDKPLVRYHYNTEDMLAAAEDPSGAAMRYAYKNAVLVRETRRGGLSFYFEYDVTAPEGWCVRTWGDGGIYDHRVTYDEARRLTLVDDSRGGRTFYYGNAMGLVERVLDATGRETRYEWDASCHKVAEVDALGHRTEWAYDPRGNIILERDATGRETLRRFDAHDLVVEVRDPAGGRWAYARDHRGLPQRATDPTGAEHRFTFDQRGSLTSVEDPAGRREEWRYDTHGELAETTDRGGAVWRYRWDDLGRLIESTDPLDARTTITRDACGRVVEVRGPTGAVTRRAYDPDGNLSAETDALGNTTRYRYGGYNRLVERIDAAGGTTSLVYDTEGDLVAVTNELGETLRLTVDLAGRVVREVGFDGRAVAFRHDGNGRRVETVSASGRVTRTEYDPLGRLTRRVVPGTWSTPERPVPVPVESLYRYDARGDLVYAQNADAEVTFERDPLGRVVRERVNGHVVESAYDPSGYRVARRTSEGHEVIYHVDARGELNGVSLDVDGGWLAAPPDRRVSAGWRMTVARDARGDEIGRRLPGGVATEWTRDPARRPLTQRAVAGPERVIAHDYVWQGETEIAAVIDARRGATHFDHDARGDLTAARRPDGSTQHRAPDAAGHVFRAPDRSDRVYAPGGVLREADGVRYGYDPDGQVTEKVMPDGRRWGYAWDGDGQLREVVRPDGARVTFAYDPLGRRVNKSFGGRTTAYVWDGNDLVHELREGATATTWVFEPHTFAPVAKLEGSRRYGVVSDHLGTPLELRDESGRLAWRAQLDLYGVPDNDVAETECPWRWPGQYEDAETGLYYNRFRYYDPASGQYLSQDPIGLAGGTGFYDYVTDPWTWTDPFGLKPRIDPAGFFAKRHEYGRGSGRGRVNIPYQGTRGRDFTQANRAAGFANTPDGYTWHHANYDALSGTGDMQLVRTDVHMSRSHSGGVSVFQQSTGISYDTPDAVRHVDDEGRLRGRQPGVGCA
jgi:RHS repeat-associated protein